ncbi:hypothetical protein CsSME_00020145 [Camellia sinensis var. sinensis]
MPIRVKEEERIERIIRNLLKLPENRRCINCNSLQAREIYFKEWDPQCHSFPDCSNQNRLRDFIKHVYVDRKFTGGRSMNKLAMVKTEEDSCHWHSGERPSSGQRSDDRSSKYYIDDRRSPGFRDDGNGSGKRSEMHRPSNAESRARGKSPVYPKSRNVTSPPVVRPVRDILGDNVPNLQVGKSPEANDRIDNESSTHGRTWTSSLTPNAQDSSSAAAGDSSQPSSKVVQDTTSKFGSQTLLVETKSCGRQELPSDLFTANHSSFPAPVPSWQVHPPYGMGYGMQYHPTAMSMLAFSNSAKSRNPFDLNDDNTQAQGPMIGNGGK